MNNILAVNHPDFDIVPALYAKGKMIVRVRRDGTGYKNRADRLVAARGIDGRWVNRSGGYTMSPTAAQKFARLYDAGFDASSWDGTLSPPRPTRVRIHTYRLGGSEFHRIEAPDPLTGDWRAVPLSPFDGVTEAENFARQEYGADCLS